MHRSYRYLSSAEAQLSLGFGEERPRESLFFALMPPAEVASKASALAQALQAGQRRSPVAPARLHVTLHFLGEYLGLPPTLLDNARQAADQWAQGGVATRPFTLCLDQLGSFAGSRDRSPCVLTGGDAGVAGVHALYEALGRALAQRGQRGAERRFVPHMTLCYGQPVPGRPVDPLCWQVEELVLLRSRVGETRYQVEGRWPLR